MPKKGGKGNHQSNKDSFAAASLSTSPQTLNFSDLAKEGIEIDDLPKSVVNRVLYLKTLHEQKSVIMEDYAKERAELEKKFLRQLSPLYNTRSDIISGKIEYPKPESDNKNEDDKNEDNKNEDGKNEDDKNEEIHGIPNFWLTALLHHEIFQDTIEEDDITALESLTDLKCIDDEDMQGFTLEFYFSANDYFTNEVLRKTYKVPNLLEGTEPVVTSIESDTVNWKQGKSLCKKSRNNGKSKGKKKTKIVKNKSFFNFFQALKIPAQGEEIDMKDMQELEEKLEPDFEQAITIRSSIIPDAILWYTGEIDNMMEFFDGLDDDDEESDDDDSDDGNETQKPTFNFKPNGGNPALQNSTENGNEQPPECKQT